MLHNTNQFLLISIITEFMSRCSLQDDSLKIVQTFTFSKKSSKIVNEIYLNRKNLSGNRKCMKKLILYACFEQKFKSEVGALGLYTGCPS